VALHSRRCLPSRRFKALAFDAALRLYLESFRLPGEAQKIDRIVNCFGRYYYEANPEVGGTFAAQADLVVAGEKQ
jgi:Sec7-like guanine-nucleotide exchange factor